MNCVNYVKKTVCMVLMLAFVLISCLGAFATSENPKKLGILASSIKITDLHTPCKDVNPYVPPQPSNCGVKF